MTFVEPTFEIDEKGRVLCLSHSYYPFFKMPNKSYFQERQMENMLTCKACDHYIQNDCFFPRSEIDKIEIDRTEGSTFLCKLCGNRIDRMLTVIHKLYFKERFKIEMPLICCSCYESLKKNQFLKESKRQSLYIIVSLLASLFFFIFLFWSWTNYFFIIWLFPLFITIFNNLRKLVKIQKGRKFYQKYFADFNGGTTNVEQRDTEEPPFQGQRAYKYICDNCHSFC